MHSSLSLSAYQDMAAPIGLDRTGLSRLGTVYTSAAEHDKQMWLDLLTMNG